MLQRSPAEAVDQFYYSINCISEITLEEPCNVSFMNKSMSIRFSDGRSTFLNNLLGALNNPTSDILSWLNS